MKRFPPVAVSLAVPLAAAQLIAGCAAPASTSQAARSGGGDAASPASQAAAQPSPASPVSPATGASASPPTDTADAAGAAGAASRAPSTTPRPVRVPSGVTAGYVVFDRQAGKVIANRQVHHRFRSASVVKILIAIDYLERRKGAIPAGDAALLKPMLRGSDDDAATALWRRGGQGKIVQRMVKKIGLTDTAPPPAAKPGFWGYTAISALDIARVYQYLLAKAEPRVRDVVMGHLRQAQQCATDGFDQYFGIPRGVPRPWAVKQGWSGYGSVPPVTCVRATTTSSDLTHGLTAATTVTAAGFTKVGTTATGRTRNPVDFGRPVLHTTGVIGDRFIMVVLTTQPAGATFGSSSTRLTALARDLYRSVL
ncbi:hypothetical protein IMZ11_00885 [Microtetraspora sp. AC03309]|uniref:hypothetical protein n=1 Tax=Microtetraspora sp. AC03309 TaxID=2779376 RepID=UPI001E5960C3|nr:hypothetical protein [Microtetraspora sp. AC03309]MCC5574195.1 hypothetical protein [Microtetraspora sp. AC03309]